MNPYDRSLSSRIKAKLVRDYLLPLPVDARHKEYSAIASMDDQPGSPNPRLLELVLESARVAMNTSVDLLHERRADVPQYVATWPGEHYRLLKAMMQVLQPRLVIEVGTWRGYGSLCMLDGLPPQSRVITIDILDWKEIDQTVLVDSDFESGQLVQKLGDLTDRDFFESLSPQIADCDFMFVDAPKDLVFESRLLGQLESLEIRSEMLLMFDDIRQWNMLDIWRRISRPKMDVTSLGHWTGTGLIDWNGQ